MFTHAITRLPGTNFAEGITTAHLGAPSYDRLQAQHSAYVTTLRRLGLQVEVLPALDGFPDAYFVEDPALVFPELAVITRPGALPRQGEEEALSVAVARYRKIVRLDEPATLEGGDVLVVGKKVWVGRSERTNDAGIDQLTKILAPFGYTVIPVSITTGLHLKSFVNTLGGQRLLIAQQFAGRAEFESYAQIIVRDQEAYAANTLYINGSLIFPKGFHLTRRLVKSLGLPIVELDVSEVQKMDGGLTCMSLRFLTASLNVSFRITVWNYFCPHHNPSHSRQ